MIRPVPSKPIKAFALQTPVLALAALLVLAAAASRLWMLPIHFSTDPNEGWNAYQAVSAMGSGALYPPPGSLIGNNYPPLSFFLVGALGRLIGDPIIAGRLVSLASVLGIAGLLFQILRRLGARAPVPGLGSLLFLALNATILRGYVALDDPQWLGHLLMTWAVLVILPHQPSQRPAPSRVMLAVFLVLLGGLTKQNLIGWPIAITAWLGWHHRSSLIVWVIGGVICITVALLACRIAFGVDFFTDLLFSARTHSIDRVLRRASGAALIIAALSWWSWPVLRQRPADDRLDLIRFAVMVTVPLGMIERSGAGVHINAHFEGAIALSLSAALALDQRFSMRSNRVIAAVALGALFVAGFALELGEVRRFPMRYAAWQTMERHIASVPGKVACETQALCFWAGQPFAIDFFVYSQYARKAGAATELDRAIAERRFAAVEVDADPPPGNPDRRTDPILLRLSSSMRPVFMDAAGRRLLMPKR